MQPTYYYLAYLPKEADYSFEELEKTVKKTMSRSGYNIEFERDDSMTGLMNEIGGLPEDSVTQDAIMTMDGFPLMISYEKGSSVGEEAKDMQQRIGKPKSGPPLDQCDQRIEVWCEEQDPDMIFFNDVLILVGEFETRWNAILVEGNSETYV